MRRTITAAVLLILATLPAMAGGSTIPTRDELDAAAAKRDETRGVVAYSEAMEIMGRVVRDTKQRRECEQRRSEVECRFLYPVDRDR